ncbi:MAG TPA: pilus (MSHA type) biogenesis protein MshL [Desulfobacteraceae bacterium]|nr:pilus (MSHA type) biogenesis protein MshL [Deltaproteobacteria bacterium]HDH87904.1 pilus (MSHA type) biogenesis protein MshL [Desulfobacteraceae bacterium]
MKRLMILSIIFMSLFLAGCTFGPRPVLETEKPSTDSLSKEIAKESEELDKNQKELRDSLEKAAPRKVEVEPVMPAYDPLEDHIVSFSMVDEDLQFVFYSLSQAVGMNLILDPSLKDEKRLITLNFEKAPASVVLKEILNTFDLYYEIDQNVIRIKQFEERIFKLNFLDTNVDMSFDVGGDVLGAGETETASGLSGSFKLSGKGAGKGNAYDVIEDMVKRVISKKGMYSLNRLSGSLYIKDTPAVIRSISKLINHLKEMLSRQILIEARIIEVALSDAYKYGIDWSLLRKEAKTATKVNEASWALGTGLVISGVRKAFTIDTAIDALRTFGDAKVVSNPSIRSKHGQPAIISVGTSYTYKKSVKTTSIYEETSRETTEVEVSTVFDGLILGVIPFIEEDGRITLLINPIKSDVDRASLEPQSVGAHADQSISLPSVGVKEISTTIGLSNGDMIMLGGLIDKREIKENKGVPFLSSIPLLGYLFRNDVKTEETRELVIILGVSLV